LNVVVKRTWKIWGIGKREARGLIYFRGKPPSGLQEVMAWFFVMIEEL
jgi:hypothetical protein